MIQEIPLDAEQKDDATEEEINDDRYEEGISCLYCYDKTTEEKKERFESRQKQIELSKLRGEKHIGGQQKK